MHRLIRVAALTASLLLLLVSASVLIGRRQLEHSLPNYLRLTDCTPPCWIGIVPGKTSLDEARERMQAMYGSMPGTQWAFDPGLPPSYLWASLIQQDNPTGVIRIRLDTRGDNVIDTIDFDFKGIDTPNRVTL